MNNKKDNMTVAEAAEIMNKSPGFIRAGLELGTLPFGSWVKLKRNTYHISRKAFYNYMKNGTPSTTVEND